MREVVEKKKFGNFGKKIAKSRDPSLSNITLKAVIAAKVERKFAWRADKESRILSSETHLTSIVIVVVIGLSGCCSSVILVTITHSLATAKAVENENARTLGCKFQAQTWVVQSLHHYTEFVL